jgi:hypothetical protein
MASPFEPAARGPNCSSVANPVRVQLGGEPVVARTEPIGSVAISDDWALARTAEQAQAAAAARAPLGRES